jgi:Ni,Fe-hydrogenase III small subunit
MRGSDTAVVVWVHHHDASSCSGCGIAILLPVLSARSQHQFLFWVRHRDISSCSGCRIAISLPVLGVGSRSYFLF